MKPNLALRIGKLKLKNPVMVASGTFGEEYSRLVDINRLGAYVAKTITLKARIGNPGPRICETPSGMLNSIGLENGGLGHFLKNKMPFLAKLKAPVIISLAGDDEDEFAELVRRLTKIAHIDAFELNLSCPNIRYGSRECLIAQDEKATYEVIKKVRKMTPRTVIAKLSPNVTDIAKIAKAAEGAGADAILLVNTFLGMAVDIETKRPKLGNIVGGLSGPAIKPLALRAAWSAYNSVKIPIIGAGGIMDYKDAIEFMLCGSSAIQVGTANFVNPKATAWIIDGIKGYLEQNKIKNINEIIGGLKIG